MRGRERGKAAAVIRGERAPGWLAALHLPARLARHDGTVVIVANWQAQDRPAGRRNRIPGVIASFSGPGLWYAHPAAGLVALLLLTASTTLGVLTARRLCTPRWPRFLTVGLHRNIALLAGVFLAVHIATIVLDSYT